MNSETYDYIVIGSGSAGGVVAGRLSESGNHKVLCMEAGEKGAGYIWSRPPAGTIFMIDNPDVNWRYSSQPNESHGNRPLYVPRGKMLGGTSAINGMVASRGLPLDYDTWAQRGCKGWSYEEFLPYIKKLETSDIGSDEFRGRTGPVKVTEAPKITPFCDLFIKSAVSVGIPYNADYSGRTMEGVAMAQQTVHNGLRQSTATQYLKPASKRPNMTILTGAEATSLILEGKRCVGVRYKRKGEMHEARVTREVILSCGTVNSPKLLELSGIGNPEILERHGIRVVHELKGVGENLQEHYAATVKYRFNRPGLSTSKKGRGWGLALEILRFAIFRSGFISVGLGTLRINARSRRDLENPDIMMSIAPCIIELKKGGQGRRMSSIEGFFMITHPHRTESTGNIHINSSDPFAPPAINFRFLNTPTDRMTAIAAVRKAREIAQAPPLSEAIAEEMAPGPNVQTDEEILEFVRNTGVTTSHMSGTCRMGHDQMAVVDDRLRVHGIAGLRIADASIMPTVISGNTSIPCMAVGEKCADMVLADAAK